MTKDDGVDIATFDRMQAPSPTTLIACIQILAASGREEIGSKAMWQMLQEAGVGCDGYTPLVALERLGVLLPSTDAAEQGRVWLIPAALHDATLSTRVSAKLWLQTLIDYLQADPRDRENLLA